MTAATPPPAATAAKDGRGQEERSAASRTGATATATRCGRCAAHSRVPSALLRRRPRPHREHRRWRRRRRVGGWGGGGQPSAGPRAAVSSGPVASAHGASVRCHRGRAWRHRGALATVDGRSHGPRRGPDTAATATGRQMRHGSRRWWTDRATLRQPLCRGEHPWRRALGRITIRTGSAGDRLTRRREIPPWCRPICPSERPHRPWSCPELQRQSCR